MRDEGNEMTSPVPSPFAGGVSDDCCSRNVEPRSDCEISKEPFDPLFKFAVTKSYSAPLVVTHPIGPWFECDC